MQKSVSIQRQIMNGYLIFVGILFVGVSLSVLSLVGIGHAYTLMEQCSAQQLRAQEVITAHYQWLEELGHAINTGQDFTGSLDSTTCSLGKWLSESDEGQASDEAIQNALAAIVLPHDELHAAAKQALTLSQTDPEAAYAYFTSNIRSKITPIHDGLTAISTQMADTFAKQQQFTNFLYLLCVAALCFFGVLCIFVAVTLGRRISGRISAPIIAVAKWSEALSSGVDNLDFQSEQLDQENSALEIQRLLTSFQEMTDNIRNHVAVIKRVSEGDLTAYVEIKSDGDSLGRSLYHLVQNNDFMFANLLQVADSVAVIADQIATSSQILADSSTLQAQAVESLSQTVNDANGLASQNAADADAVMTRINQTSQTIEEGQTEMDGLMGSVRDIEQASGKISLVMKSINDIAFQTNILALNAAVEAARAGTAGKGFAVVADEVRNLALKSAEAADQSRVLIENSIQAAKNGSVISAQAAQTFQTIVDNMTEIGASIHKIDTASEAQQEMMQHIHDEIGKISAAVADNAASSEETAASTQQMNDRADEIRAAMKRFNLRQRQPDAPYIPPEKQNDAEFIKIATENFRQAKRNHGLNPSH